MSQTNWIPVLEPQDQAGNLTPMLIGGEWRTPSAVGAEPVSDPASGEVLCRVGMDADGGSYVKKQCRPRPAHFPPGVRLR